MNNTQSPHSCSAQIPDIGEQCPWQSALHVDVAIAVNAKEDVHLDWLHVAGSAPHTTSAALA